MKITIATSKQKHTAELKVGDTLVVRGIGEKKVTAVISFTAIDEVGIVFSPPSSLVKKVESNRKKYQTTI